MHIPRGDRIVTKHH